MKALLPLPKRSGDLYRINNISDFYKPPQVPAVAAKSEKKPKPVSPPTAKSAPAVPKQKASAAAARKLHDACVASHLRMRIWIDTHLLLILPASLDVFFFCCAKLPQNYAWCALG